MTTPPPERPVRRPRGRHAAHARGVGRRFAPVLVGTLVLAVGAGAGSAYAYFTASGSGTGTGAVGTVQAVGVVASTSPSSQLYPGGTADVTVKVHNPNRYPITVTTVVGAGPITATAAHPSCTTTGVTFTTQTGLTGPGYTIGPTGTGQLDFTGAAYMDTSSSTGCQGASFSIPVAVRVKT